MKTFCSSQARIDSPSTIRQLQEELLIAFPGARRDAPLQNDDENPCVVNREDGNQSRVFWNERQGTLHAVLFDNSSGLEAKATASLRPVQPPDTLDLRFANAYVRIFNEDVNAAPLLLRHQELWETLSLSRAARAIARLNSFSTTPFLRWLSTIEAASHLKYEGASFQSVVLMSKQQKWISRPTGDGYVALQRPVQFSKALLEEKWIRAISWSDAVGLHGLGHSGNIVGVVSLPTSRRDSSDGVLLPTKLQPIAALVQPGAMAFVCAPNGDLYVVLPNGAVFVKSQGRWQYQNFASFQLLLSQYVPSPIVRPLLQLLLDLSYSRKGALFAIPSDISKLGELVPDHTHNQRTNMVLRTTVSGLRLDSNASREILLAAAAVDGAIVLSDAGVVLDVACMIGEPSGALLSQAGHTALTRFPGARSTAAWNCSIYGLGFKVSEDGPISVFSKGQLVGQLG